MRHLRIALLLAAAVPLAACASSHLIVEQPSHATIHASAVTLVYDETSTGVPAASAAYVQQKMNEAFYGGTPVVFSHGQDLTVRYHFVGYDRGSRLGRYMLGPLGVGEAQMVLEAQFVDPSGTVVAIVRGESAVRGGFFGGSANTAIDKAVREIRTYAIEHFRP
jgi:hypothetical protein